MKHLYFVRHGLSEMNVEGRYSSSTNTPLTQIGTEQAIAAGKWARENGIVFDVVLSSPLTRAHETAKHIATEINYNHEDIILHDDLRERYFGAIEGVHWKNVPFDQAAYKSDPFIIDTIENAERIADLQFRANQMYEFIQSLPYDTILVVSHGTFGRAFQRSVKKLPITEFGDRFENAQIVKLI